MFMEITGIDLFDQNVGMACANVRLRCSWISLVLIYLIKMWVMTQVSSDVHEISIIYLIKMWVWHMFTD